MTPEQLEIWRSKFEKTQDSEYLGRFPSGNYQWSFIEERFAGFVLAMKSLVVELPERNTNEYRPEFSSGWNSCLNRFIKSLQSAGIKYREKE